MHVGFLVPDLTDGHGWGHYSRHLLTALAAPDVHITVLAATNSPPLPDLPNLTLHRVLPPIAPMARFRLPKMLALVPRVRHLLAACDFVHTTCEIYAPLGVAAAGTRPHLLTLHGSYARFPQVRGFPVGALYRWAYAQSTLVCVSHYTQHVAHEVVPHAQTVVVNNGVDPTRYADLPALPNPPDVPVVLTVGGVKARKGTRELVQAIAQVRQTLPDVQCVILGNTQVEPGYTAHIHNDIERLQLHDNVQLLGFVDEQTLLGWYGAADVMALPSMNSGWKFEGFGLVHLEASAAGLPVIGTRDCGAEDAIDHEQTGLLVSQENITAELPAALLKLLTHPSLAAQMGAAGKRKAQSQTWQHVAAQMRTCYANALD